MKLSEQFITSSGLKLWTQKLSNNNTETCVLIAGAGAPAMFWTDDFCQNLVDSGYDVIRFDNRDIGLSDAVDWDKHPYTIEDLSHDVINILDAYGIDHAHIVGHSMGGMVSQWLAIAHPERVKSYTSISVATCGIIGHPPQEIMDVLLENKPTQDFENDLPAFMRSWKILNGSYELDEELAINYTRDLYTRSKHKVGVAWHHIWCEEHYRNLIDKLNNVSVPGLFIHGEQDPLIPVQGAIETQRAAPNSNLLILPKMGHMIFNRQLESELVGALVAHLRR